MGRERAVGTALVVLALAGGCNWDSRLRPVERNVTVRPSAAEQTLTPLLGLVSWYAAEDNANDATFAHPGTEQGGVTYAPGLFGQSFSFDGVDDYVDLDGDWFDLQTFTIAMWVKPDATQIGAVNLIDNGYVDSGHKNWAVQRDNGVSGTAYRVSEGSGVVGDLAATFGLLRGYWHYVVIARQSGGEVEVYVDDFPQSTQDVGGPIVYDLPRSLRLAFTGGGANNWKGLLDELEIYDRALDRDEFSNRLLEYAGTLGCDASPFAVQPVGATVPLGQPVTFSAQLTGAALSHVQWYRYSASLDEWVAIPGATNASYSIASVQVSDVTDYHLAVTNCYPFYQVTSISDQVSLTIGTAVADQSINFSALPDKTYGDPPFALSATASSGLAVSFGATGNCSVSGNLVTITGAGSCAVTASQAGNASYNPAPNVPRAFSIVKANQTINFVPLADMTFGDGPFAVSAAASSGLVVGFAVVGNCTLAGNTVTMTGAGSCTVTASQPGDANYDAATDVVRSFAIAKASQTVTLSPIADHFLGDAPFIVGATGGASGQPVTFTSAGSCSVSGNSVTINGVGSCTVTASQAGDANYNPGSAFQTFNVLFHWTGFFQPIDNLPTVYSVNAVRAIPI